MERKPPSTNSLLLTPECKPRRLAAQDILGGGSEAEIEHNGAIYRLRLTAQGKLILTK